MASEAEVDRNVVQDSRDIRETQRRILAGAREALQVPPGAAPA
jgi:hypothetical protein